MNTEKHHLHQLEELIYQYLTGSASAEDRELILRWIRESRDNRRYFDECRALYLATKVVQKPSGFSREESWKKIQAAYYREKFRSGLVQQKKNRRRTLAVALISSAAAIVLAFLIGRYAFSGHISPAAIAGENEIIVPFGAKSNITLSDGTKVWLNAGSKLKYPGVFSGNTREVYLEGEAFFDVKKQTSGLFVVRTSNLDIKVYGTQFNVKSYPDEAMIQTTLVKGSVCIEDRSGKATAKPLFLKPNQTAIYYKKPVSIQGNDSSSAIRESGADKSPETMVVKPVETPVPITSWKDSRWVIMGEELESLAIKLERRYNVHITFADESLKRYKFSGTLKDETFEQVLRIIQISAPIQFRVEGNDVVFSEDPLYRKKYDKMISK